MSGLPARVRTSVILRSFAIQASFNYRTMVGGGFAFALLPVLRHLHGDDRETLERAVDRHAEHFNAHPYLAALALGAVARMEAEGRDADAIRRFKRAVRGPLGSLGDRLVWVTWLPISALLALGAALLGAGPVGSTLLFLGLYNAGHVGLRLWAFRTGFLEGAGVGARLHATPLRGITDWLSIPAALLVGGVAGLAAFSVGWPAVDRVWLWLPVTAAMVTLGTQMGQAAWKWAAWFLCLALTSALVAGAFA